MKFICLMLLIISRITGSRSERYEVVGPADPVFAVAGEDVILPCSVKPNISVVDMRVEWFRADQKDSQLVHLYEDHEDRNTGQIQSYRERTKLIHQELQRGNASLKLSSVRVSDEGRYKCFIQSKSWFDDATVDVRVEAVGSPPVITEVRFDRSGGLHLQCESEGWYPEPDLEWLDSEGVRLNSETTEKHRNTDGFSLKHTVTVRHSNDKIHCRVRMKHHMLETEISISSNMFFAWRTSVIVISVFVVLTLIAGILFVHKYRAHRRLKDEKRRTQHERDQLKMIVTKAVPHLRTHKVNVILDADSAHKRLIVSEDGKQVELGDELERELDGNEEQNGRFMIYFSVLGKDKFSSGCFYYEVQVKEQTKWFLGVVSESIEGKGRGIRMSPQNGYWTVGLRYGKYLAYNHPPVLLSLTVKPQRIGVFVDYDEGLVSFYDVESMSHIYTFSDQCFNENLFPFFSLGYLNENFTPLTICDDY